MLVHTFLRNRHALVSAANPYTHSDAAILQAEQEEEEAFNEMAELQKAETEHAEKGARTPKARQPILIERVLKQSALGAAELKIDMPAEADADVPRVKSHAGDDMNDEDDSDTKAEAEVGEDAGEDGPKETNDMDAQEEDPDAEDGDTAARVDNKVDARSKPVIKYRRRAKREEMRTHDDYDGDDEDDEDDDDAFLATMKNKEKRRDNVHDDEEDEEEEEEEALLNGSDSDEDEEEEEEEDAGVVPDENLRALLDDGKKKDGANEFFDDEAEMSEDGGHEDDYKEKDDDELEVVRDLIGAGGPETGMQEKRRAQLHAQWNEDIDKQEEAEALYALENGYRSKRGRDDDENMGMDEMRRRANRRANIAGADIRADANRGLRLEDMIPRLPLGVSAVDEIDEARMSSAFDDDLERERVLQEIALKDTFLDAHADEMSKNVLKMISTNSASTRQRDAGKKFGFGRAPSSTLQRTTSGSGVSGRAFVFTKEKLRDENGSQQQSGQRNASGLLQRSGSGSTNNSFGSRGGRSQGARSALQRSNSALVAILRNASAAST